MSSGCKYGKKKKLNKNSQTKEGKIKINGPHTDFHRKLPSPFVVTVREREEGA